MSDKVEIVKLDTEPLGELNSPFRNTMLRLWGNPSARLGGFLAITMIIIAILVPLLDNYDAKSDRNLRGRYNEPDCAVGYVNAVVSGTANSELYEYSCEYPFGADKLGRSIFRRVGHGMSVSLQVSVYVVIIALIAGTLIGLTAGFFGGWRDSVLMRLMDIILAFPSLLLAIVLVTIFGAGLTNGMIAIAVTQIPIYARLSRSMAITIRETEYVMSARSLGASEWRILFRHVLPNSLSPLIVQSTLLMGTAVIETASLGFLGLGQQAPFPELGKMLAESQQGLLSGKWWLMVFPGIVIVLIVLGFNLLGDGLRDALDPRLNKN